VAEDLYSISNGNFEKINKQEVFFEIKSLNEIKNDTYQLNERITFNPFGEGIIVEIDRQKTLTSGKYNLILDVAFNFGQSCKFSKILDIKSNNAEAFFES
jgi:hypothetical protein